MRFIVYAAIVGGLLLLLDVTFNRHFYWFIINVILSALHKSPLPYDMFPYSKNT